MNLVPLNSGNINPSLAIVNRDCLVKQLRRKLIFILCVASFKKRVSWLFKLLPRSPAASAALRKMVAIALLKLKLIIRGQRAGSGNLFSEKKIFFNFCFSLMLIELRELGVAKMK